MSRLTTKAYDLLQAEILRCTTQDEVGRIQQEIAFKRLNRLQMQEGSPASQEELEELFSDLCPGFNPAVLKAAAKANRPPRRIPWQLKLAAIGSIGLVGLAGMVWAINQPNPYLWRSVAQIAPELLIPTFMEMDRNYRQAIAATEQADQLINHASSPADFAQGAAKAKIAQASLDKLPVWFLGYYPQRYCGWFSCSWRFTLDEFEGARKNVARMEARLFQERNAQQQLEDIEQALANAKQQYQEASNSAEQAPAMTQWQQALDRLKQLPPQTLAGQTAKRQLPSLERDFQAVVGFTAGNARSGSLIQAAQEFARYAAQSASAPALSVEQWEKVQTQWQDAIDYLKQIKLEDPDYISAQKLLANYRNRLADAKIRQSQEEAAQRVYERAQQMNQQLQAMTAGATSPSIKVAWLQNMKIIEQELATIPAGTTVRQNAQTMLAAVRRELQKQGG